MERLKRSLREADVVAFEDYHYIVHPVTDGIPLVEPALLEEVVEGIRSVADLERADKIVAPEAMGIHHATALSLETRIPFVVVRKRSYGLDGEVAVHQRTGYSEGELFVNNVEAGDRVVFVDDMYSTGGTLEAVCSTLLEMDVEIVDAVVVLCRKPVEPDLPVGVKWLLEVEVVDGEVVVHE